MRTLIARILMAMADCYRAISPLRRGQIRLRAAVAHCVKALGPHPAMRMDFETGDQTLPFWISPSSSVGECVWMFRQFQRADIDDCIRRLRASPSATFLDIGANVGLFSILVARGCPQTRVIAVEPNPNIGPVLQKNLAEHAPAIAAVGSRLETHAVALGDRDGQASFFAARDDSASSLHVMSHLTGRSVAVPLRRGDALLAELKVDAVALCKLDVEGGELVVLRGLAETLRRQRIGCLRMEINRRCCAAAGHTEADLVSLLADHGYRMTSESEARFRAAGWVCEDFLFLPGRRPV
jgi:FkbM family methyltransferase